MRAHRPCRTAARGAPLRNNQAIHKRTHAGMHACMRAGLRSAPATIGAAALPLTLTPRLEVSKPAGAPACTPCAPRGSDGNTSRTAVPACCNAAQREPQTARKAVAGVARRSTGCGPLPRVAHTHARARTHARNATHTGCRTATATCCNARRHVWPLRLLRMGGYVAPYRPRGWRALRCAATRHVALERGAPPRRRTRAAGSVRFSATGAA